MRASRKYRKRVGNYLRWLDGTTKMFRPPLVTFSPDGPTAADALFARESLGHPLPDTSSEPELLADYIQGKLGQDWHVSEWREGCAKGLFRWEEFIGTFGLTRDEVQRLLVTHK